MERNEEISLIKVFSTVYKAQSKLLSKLDLFIECIDICERSDLNFNLIFEKTLNSSEEYQ
jgi:hypothetical protein